MSYLRTDTRGQDTAWFEGFIAEATETLPAENNEYEQLSEDRFTLSSGGMVHARWFAWRDEDTDLRFVQLQAMILTPAGGLIVANGAMLKPIEETYRPIFEEILRSTRLIPEETTLADEAGMMSTVTAFLEEEGWAFFPNDEGDEVLTLCRGNNGQWNGQFVIREEEEQLLFYSLCPFHATESTRDEVVELLMRANHALALGCFDLDYDDGAIRFRTGIDIEDDRLTVALVRNLVVANVTMMDLYLPDIAQAIGPGEDELDN